MKQTSRSIKDKSRRQHQQKPKEHFTTTLHTRWVSGMYYCTASFTDIKRRLRVTAMVEGQTPRSTTQGRSSNAPRRSKPATTTRPKHQPFLALTCKYCTVRIAATKLAAALAPRPSLLVHHRHHHHHQQCHTLHTPPSTPPYPHPPAFQSGAPPGRLRPPLSRRGHSQGPRDSSGHSMTPKHVAFTYVHVRNVKKSKSARCGNE